MRIILCEPLILVQNKFSLIRKKNNAFQRAIHTRSEVKSFTWTLAIAIWDNNSANDWVPYQFIVTASVTKFFVVDAVCV